MAAPAGITRTGSLGAGRQLVASARAGRRRWLTIRMLPSKRRARSDGPASATAAAHSHTPPVPRAAGPSSGKPTGAFGARASVCRPQVIIVCPSIHISQQSRGATLAAGDSCELAGAHETLTARRRTSGRSGWCPSLLRPTPKTGGSFTSNTRAEAIRPVSWPGILRRGAAGSVRPDATRPHVVRLGDAPKRDIAGRPAVGRRWSAGWG